MPATTAFEVSPYKQKSNACHERFRYTGRVKVYRHPPGRLFQSRNGPERKDILMRKLVVAASAVMVALALIVAPVAAITGDWVKDFEHPFVGLAVFYDANGDFIWRCSGSLLSPTVFLTAGHCADTIGGAVTARVYFQQ